VSDTGSCLGVMTRLSNWAVAQLSVIGLKAFVVQFTSRYCHL